MSNPLAKITALIKKTGDNCVVLDSEGNPAFVVMSIERYQRLGIAPADISALTEEQLLNKVNADIAAWKASHEGEDFDNWPALDPAEVGEDNQKELAKNGQNSLNEAKNPDKIVTADNKYYFEPLD